MSKGKCFSCAIRDKRNKKDFYSTPYSVTEQLLEYEFFDFKKTVQDPCCGKMAIVKILNDNFSFVGYNDLYYENNINTGYDFLSRKDDYYIHKSDYIITNPPFSLADQFIQRSKEKAKLKFAMLLPLSYLHGVGRYSKKIFLDLYPLSTIYVFTRYIMFSDKIREDGKYKTGMIAFAWFIWENYCDKAYPEIKWINNQKYILSKEDK